MLHPKVVPFWAPGMGKRSLFGLRVWERGPFLGSRYGNGVALSGWRNVKGVPFQGKLCESVPIFEIQYEIDF